ncbi:MAG: hypothetical protein R3242_09530 [Akkermansiaceae bacterium]|nr:hypothetical protein [Akkermansiaceae bacterium]
MTEQEETSSSDHTLPLIIGGVVLAFGIYVLSIGPVAMMASRHDWPEKPLVIFYAPVLWLYKHTPLDDPLDNYIDWWLSFS